MSPETFALKLVSINCEDLFLFIDQQPLLDPHSLNEREWQGLSSSTVENKSLAKCRALGRELLSLNADVIACSEVGGLESLENFSKLFLHDRYRALLIEGNSDRGIDIGYLVDRKHGWGLDLRTHRNRPIGYLYPHERLSKETNLPDGSELKITSQRFSRDVAELRIVPEGGGQPLAILLTVHLKSARDPLGVDPFGRERREAEFKTLLEIYREVVDEIKQKVPVILCGDFNGTVTGPNADPEFSEIKKTDLVSVLDLKQSRDETPCSHSEQNLRSSLASNQTGTMPSKSLDADLRHRFTWIGFNRFRPINRKEIDFILISSGFAQNLDPKETGIHRYKNDLGLPLSEPSNWDERALFPSDHFPVFATFRF